jgi:hypothetical protein
MALLRCVLTEDRPTISDGSDQVSNGVATALSESPSPADIRGALSPSPPHHAQSTPSAIDDELAALERLLLAEIPGMLKEGKKAADELVATIFDGSAETHGGDVDRLMAELLGSSAEPSPAVESSPTGAALTEPAEATPVEPIPEPDPTPPSLEEPADDADRETDPALVEIAAIAEAAATPPVEHVGFIVRLIDLLVLDPLRSLSAPVVGLSPTMRLALGAFALSVLVWIPAVWWMAQRIAAEDRIRPLTAVELDELVRGQDSVASAAEEKDAKHGAAKVDDPASTKQPAKPPAKKPAKGQDQGHGSDKKAAAGGHGH